MLTQLSIRNLAVASAIDLEFADGMTALSGETGAGKSIVLDALGLALGSRTSADIVRHLCKRAEINAVFDLQELPQALSWLEDRELDQNNECIIRRTITAEGRSRSYVNGQIVPLQELRSLGALLMDIHNQHEHQSLLKPETQQQLIDNFGDCEKQRQKVCTSYKQWRAKAAQLEALLSQKEELNAKTQLLSYQVGELDQFALSAGELEQLESEQQRLANADQILNSLQQVSDGILGCDGGCLEQLSKSINILNQYGDTIPELQNARDLLQEALIQAEEANSELRQAQVGLELDPARLQEVEQRLGSAHELARKHRVAAHELAAKHQQLQLELSELTCNENSAEGLEAQVIDLRSQYNKEASLLSKSRAAASKQLEQKVQQQLKHLGMTPTFQIAIKSLPSPAPGGMEEMEMMISMNPGQPPKHLRKIASGGELSRISLAIQVITAVSSQTPTLVFDEVDVGIGGPTAEIVGRLLRKLGSQTQILCVTHLPQVASQAHHHLVVSKSVSKGMTQSTINRLAGENRTLEIARMLGGVDITEHSLAHAREMLASSSVH